MKVLFLTLVLLLSGCGTVSQVGSLVMLPIQAYCSQTTELQKQAIREGWTDGKQYINCNE